MLTRLQFTNFKSWQSANLTCGNITGVFGTNSSGKTSIIQFLLLMKQTKDATDRAVSLELNNGGFVELGTIKDVIHKHDLDSEIKGRLTFDLASELSLSDPSRKKNSIIAKGRRLTLRSEVVVRQQAPFAKRLSYTLGEMRFTWPAPGSEDTELGVFMGPEVRHGEAEVHARVQA